MELFPKLEIFGRKFAFDEYAKEFDSNGMLKDSGETACSFGQLELKVRDGLRRLAFEKLLKIALANRKRDSSLDGFDRRRAFRVQNNGNLTRVVPRAQEHLVGVVNNDSE